MARSSAYALLLVALVSPAQGAAQPACGGDPIATVTVASVTDGRTFTTTDRGEVRLAGIEAPGAKAALDALATGKAVALRRAGKGEDRYGRIVAYAYAGGALIQQQLVSEGRAYVAARVGPKPCADALFAAERTAREASRGLWAAPELRPKSAANRDEILAAKGRFALVEGRVLGVRESGGAIYLNFGTYYTRDFSALILKRDAAQLTLAPKLLEGKRIRVRGVIEARRGPLIEIKWPEQIELIE